MQQIVNQHIKKNLYSQVIDADKHKSVYQCGNE